RYGLLGHRSSPRIPESPKMKAAGFFATGRRGGLLCPALPRVVRHEKDAEQLTLIPGDLRGRYNKSSRARVGAQIDNARELPGTGGSMDRRAFIQRTGAAAAAAAGAAALLKTP